MQPEIKEAQEAVATAVPSLQRKNVPTNVSTPTCEPTQPSDFLEISPYQADGGELIGKTPADLPSEILSRYYRETNPLKAIRARCLDCCCGNASEVRKCVAVDCPSWPFRMGVNPFRQKRTLSQEQKRAMAERLRAAP